MKKACIIPAFNEAYTVRNVVRIALSFPGFSEVYLVDDGSIDGTRDRVSDLQGKHRHFKIIKNSKNIGKTKSVIEAIKRANADVIVLLDADLLYLEQADLQKLIDPVEKGRHDLVILDRWASDRASILHGWAGIVRIYSGERAFKKSAFMEIDFSKFVDHPYILENAMNLSFLDMGLKIRNTTAKNLFAVSRRRKTNAAQPFIGYLKMVMDFIKYIGIRDILRQAIEIETDLLPFSRNRTGLVFVLETIYSAIILCPLSNMMNLLRSRRTGKNR